MRKFNFKSRGSVLRVIEEPVIKKKKWSLDRMVYLSVIAMILFVVVRYSYNYINVIKGNGQIVFRKLPVNFVSDIRLKKMLIKEGQEVKKGDTLFSYIQERTFEEEQRIIRQTETKNKLFRDVMDLEREIMLKKLDLNLAKGQLLHHENEYSKTVDRVLLEIETKNTLHTLKQQRQDLKLKIRHLNNEISTLSQLKRSIKDSGNRLIESYASNDNDTFYVSPVNGLSGTINFEPNEVCYKQQEVVTIHDSKELLIRAYFNQKHNDDLEVGKTVYIEFSDGTSTRGLIRNSYITTYALPSEFQKKYEPTTRNIMVDIEPINENTEEFWRKFYLMNVEVKLYRFGTLFG